MNKLTLFLAFSISAFHHLHAQDQDNRLVIEEYIQQSETQKKVGLAMICIGAVAFGLGALIIDSSYGLEDPAVGSGIILALGGGASTLIGIPVLIISGVKARRAAELSLQATRIQNPMFLDQQTKVFPSVGISIPLNTKNP